METENLIGQLIKGFKFEGFPNYMFNMRQYENVNGKITWVSHDVVSVKFPDDEEYNYPYLEALKHIVKEEEQSIEEILNNIKNLTKDL